MAQRDLTQGPIWKALAAVSGPTSFGILAVLAIGLADAYFLGKLGEAPLAAVGFIYPVTTAITSLAIGLSAGVSALVSQRLGEDGDSQSDAPARLAIHALMMGVALSVVMAAAFHLSSGGLFQLMGAGENALREVLLYTPLWAVSFPFLMLQMIINASFRAHGDGATSAAIMVLIALFAIGLNPILIFGWGPIPSMGTEGAALATLIGRIVGAAAALIWAWRAGVISSCASPLRGLWQSWREILKVGVPSAFSNAINPAGMALVTAAVATVGEAAVAGFGAATRVQSVVLVPLLALSAGIGPVVGQNWGADAVSRARSAIHTSGWFCVIYGLAAATCLTLFADPLAALFAESDKDAHGYAAHYLAFVSWSFAGYGALVTANAAMNARSKAAYSMGLSLARILVVYVPAAWLGVAIFGYSGILMAAIAANLLAILGAIWCLRRTELLESG
ncbi:MATE family efflux transporter [uncultured Roseobacter sp.]|uniref:MATE family efflux transporter n=1 Tax=uncultured Roseobacter sp. TaxID=114847 RepID=UPI0026170C8E|nr:MATE family efflux transporter [uncultured Roseobacter sp.]